MSTPIYISKQKIRRGNNNQRLATRLDQGELAYTTDTKRIYVGNGILSGGNHVSSKIHSPLVSYNSLSVTIAEVGDIVRANSNWYQLTASPYSNISNWGDVSQNFSNEFTFDDYSTVSVSLSSLSANKLNPDSFNLPLNITDSKINLEYNTNFFELSSDQLSIKNNSITKNELLSSSFGNGISGGNGNIITLAVDSDTFFFINGELNLDFSTISATDKNKFFQPQSSTLSLTSLNAVLGDITTINGNLYQLSGIPAVDPTKWAKITNSNAVYPPVSSINSLSSLNAKLGDLGIVENGPLYQLTATPPSTLGNWARVGDEVTTVDTTASEFDKVDFDQYGKISGSSSSVYDTLTGNSSLNSSNSLSSIFNGTPTHTLSGGIPGLTITKFEAISSNGTSTVNITLSSAGFLSFEGGFQSRTGQDIGRFAIPIFAY